MPTKSLSSSQNSYSAGFENICSTTCRINAIVVRAINLNTAPSSSLLVPEHEVLAIGKFNGEIVFVPFTLDPNQDSRRRVTLIRNRQQFQSPITALTIGRWSISCPDDEIVSISANGFLQIIQPPTIIGDLEPVVKYTQMIHANIMCAHLHPIEKKNQMELIVVMTDRVVRTYRWDEDQTRFVAVGKWELTAQIVGIAIGDTPLQGIECWAKLHTSNQYVACRLGQNKSVGPKFRKKTVSLANMRERRLNNPIKGIACVATIRLDTLNILTSITKYGLVYVYAYNEKTIKKLVIPPVLEFSSLPDCVKLSICHLDGCLVIAVTAHIKRVQIHTISMDFIVDLILEMEDHSDAEVDLLKSDQPPAPLSQRLETITSESF